MQGVKLVPDVEWKEGRVFLNTILSALQQGSLTVSGLKLDRSQTTAPTTVPGIQDPNLVLVNVAGVWTLYHWNGAAWVVV